MTRSWGGDGVGNVFISADDLARLDFSNAYYTWDCGRGGVPGPRSDSRGESDPAEGPASFWP